MKHIREFQILALFFMIHIGKLNHFAKTNHNVFVCLILITLTHIPAFVDAITRKVDYKDLYPCILGIILIRFSYISENWVRYGSPNCV